MSRFGLFILLSLVLHAACFGFLHRFSLHVPPSPEIRPVSVRLAASRSSRAENVEPTEPGKEEDSPERQDRAFREPESEIRPKEDPRQEGGLSGGTPDVSKMPEPSAGKKRVQKAEFEKMPETRRGIRATGGEHEEAGKPEGELHREKPARTVSELALEPSENNPQSDKVFLEESPTRITEKEAAWLEVHDAGAGADAGQEPRMITGDLVLRKVLPFYPLASRRKGEEGDVVLRVALSDSGRVSDISVEESSGSAALDRAAMQAVKQWHFSREAGTKVLVPVSFRLE